MSDFERWSKWFACGRELGRDKKDALALMAWIAAHAASDGTGIELDEHSWSSLAEETGLTVDQGRQAFDTLVAHGLVTAVGQETPERLLARAVI
ncbi:MAG: hypothetical protein ACK4TP_18230 [Hyphomicrobium sp.]|jgi:hypothetical protein